MRLILCLCVLLGSLASFADDSKTPKTKETRTPQEVKAAANPATQADWGSAQIDLGGD